MVDKGGNARVIEFREELISAGQDGARGIDLIFPKKGKRICCSQRGDGQ